MREGFTDYWNHNTHYHPLVLDAVPENCGAALDVGCGDGLLVRKLADRAREVTGVDADPAMVRLARARTGHLPHVTCVTADFLTAEERFPAASYDLVTAVATVHHMPFTPAVTALARRVAPGGRLVVLGLGRDRTALDWARTAAAAPVAAGYRRLRHEVDPPGVPMRDPELSWGEVRRRMRRLLPGCRFRRHLLWRFSVVWHRP